MAQPVWVLSVDLQTKTATFQSGMADAARSARGAFNDIKSGSSEMSNHVGMGMFASRHAVMAVSEAFGDTMPRAITALLVHIGPLGAALEAAFPYAAIGLAAVLIVEHFEKIKEAQEKLALDSTKMGTSIQGVFNNLDEKMLQAEKRADELRDDHLGALRKELQLINSQNLDELAHSFEVVAKSADVTFADLKSHWYTFGIGADGAKHALDTFQAQYDSLLKQGRDKEASDLLKGTRESAERILEAQKQAHANSGVTTSNPDDSAKVTNAFLAANAELKKAGVRYTEDEMKAQSALIETLKAQETVEEKIAALKSLQGQNAKTDTSHVIAKEAEERQKQALEAQRRYSEEVQKFNAAVEKQSVADLDEGEREKIAATKDGSAARLAAISEAIKEEQLLNLTGTNYYKELLLQRVNTAREMAEEEARVRAEAAREMADNDLRMGELMIQAERQKAQLIDSTGRISADQQLQQQIEFANEEYALQMSAIAQRIAALDKGEKDYANKLQQLLNQQKQLYQQHENEITVIRNKAETEQNQKTLAALNQFTGMLNSAFTSALTGQKSWASAFIALGGEVETAMIQMALKHIEANLMTKESDAASAARKAFLAGEDLLPGPAGIVLGGVMAAGAFAAVMAFEGGGVVPGVGRGDVVPAMLSPGEGIVPNSMMDHLNTMARSGSMGGGVTHVMHYRPTFHVNTVDAEGVRGMLTKHTKEFTRHFQNEIRKANQ